MTTNVVEPAILRYELGGKGLKIDLKGLKTMFLTINTFFFGRKIFWRTWGVPPLRPFMGNIFGERFLAGFGGCPPPFTDKIRQKVFEKALFPRSSLYLIRMFVLSMKKRQRFAT